MLPPPPLGFFLVLFCIFGYDCYSTNLPNLCPETHVSMRKKNNKNNFQYVNKLRVKILDILSIIPFSIHGIERSHVIL